LPHGPLEKVKWKQLIGAIARVIVAHRGELKMWWRRIHRHDLELEIAEQQQKGLTQGRSAVRRPASVWE
jgi:hypothetical protein